MAPKRRGSIFGAAVSRGKRTVRRPTRVASPSASEESSAATPTVEANPPSPRIDTLAGRIITTGRKVDFHFFEQEGFSIGKRLIDMGWEKLCSLDIPTYPSLVKFYHDLSRGDGGIISFVRGKRIHLTSEILGNLLQIPIDGSIANSHSERGSALSRLLGRNATEFEEVKANQLSLELRLLHNICSRILFPKTGRFEYVSERDIVVMDCVITGQPINLPGMIISYMAEAGSRHRSSLPYGMVLTLAFRSQGVIISDSEPKKNLRHTDYYSSATLHRMGFVKTNGNWGRKGNQEEGAAEGDHAEPAVRHVSPSHINPAPPAPAPTFASSSTHVTEGFSEVQLEQLKSLMLEHENRIKEDFRDQLLSIKHLCHSLDEKLNASESSSSSSSSSLLNEMKTVLEKLKDIGGDSDIYSKKNAELQVIIDKAAVKIEEKVNEFLNTQREGMSKILEGINRIIKF